MRVQRVDRCSFTDVQNDQALRPSPLNVHRLLLTGVMLAAKLMDDKYYNNSYYAKVGLGLLSFVVHNQLSGAVMTPCPARRAVHHVSMKLTRLQLECWQHVRA